MSERIGELGPPVLFVEDLGRAKTFYTETLGFSVAFEDETSAAVMMGEDMMLLVTVASGEEMLPGAALGTPGGQRSVGIFNLFVENVDAAFATLKSQGVSFIVEPVDRYWGRRTAHFTDPDGVIWEISQSIE